MAPSSLRRRVAAVPDTPGPVGQLVTRGLGLRHARVAACSSENERKGRERHVGDQAVPCGHCRSSDGRRARPRPQHARGRDAGTVRTADVAIPGSGLGHAEVEYTVPG